MLYLSFRPAAGERLMSLHGWERERLSDAIIRLAESPRPPNARRVGRRGQAYDVWVATTRVFYRVVRDDDNRDVGLVIMRIAEGTS